MDIFEVEGEDMSILHYAIIKCCQQNHLCDGVSLTMLLCSVDLFGRFINELEEEDISVIEKWNDFMKSQTVRKHEAYGFANELYASAFEAMRYAREEQQDES